MGLMFKGIFWYYYAISSQCLKLFLSFLVRYVFYMSNLEKKKKKEKKERRSYMIIYIWSPVCAWCVWYGCVYVWWTWQKLYCLSLCLDLYFCMMYSCSVLCIFFYFIVWCPLRTPSWMRWRISRGLSLNKE